MNLASKVPDARSGLVSVKVSASAKFWPTPPSDITAASATVYEIDLIVDRVLILSPPSKCFSLFVVYCRVASIHQCRTEVSLKKIPPPFHVLYLTYSSPNMPFSARVSGIGSRLSFKCFTTDFRASSFAG